MLVRLRRAVIAIVVSVVGLIVGTGATAQAQPAATQASCWVNVFAWVSTSPSNQGNLSSLVSCNPTVQKISQTMYVHDWNTGAVVATVGPVDQFNTTSAGIAYSWFCNRIQPQSRWGEVHGTVVEYGGAVSTGSWSTQVLSC
jgi:hypothetical protein